MFNLEILTKLRQWHQKSLANSFTTLVIGIALVSIAVVGGTSLAIIYSLDLQSHRAAFRHKALVVSERLEDPVRVMERVLTELSRSSMFSSALLDSGGRSAYVRPFLQNYSFPVPATNGIALCDINGALLAGSQILSTCNSNSSEFRQVIADGKPRQKLIESESGGTLLTLYHGITAPYTGSIEGIAVAQIYIDELLAPLAAELKLQSVRLRISPDSNSLNKGRAQKLLVAENEMVIPLHFGKTAVSTDLADLLLTDQPLTISEKFSTLLAAYLIATLLLIALVSFRAKRASQTLVEPLIALRNQTNAIALNGDLSQPILKEGLGEVGQLAKSIQAMVAKIQSAHTERQEIEARYRLLFEASNEAILMAWPDGRIESANAEALRLFGYTEIEIRNLGRSGVLDLSDLRLPKALDERKATGTFRGELTGRHKDGTTFPIEVVSSIYYDAKGTERTSNFFRDITDRKRIESELQASLERLKIRDRALSAISQGVLISGPDRLITWANKAFENITGYSESEILGMSCSFLQGPETSPYIVNEMRESLSTLQPFLGEILNYHKDGSSFWNELSITPVFDSAGKLTQFVGVQRDISKRKNAELALRANQLLISTVFDSLDQMVAVLDPAGYIIAVNEAWRSFAKANGAPQSVCEGIGRNYLSTCEEKAGSKECDDAQAAKNGVLGVLAGTDEAFELEYACHSPDEERWFNMRVIRFLGPTGGAVVLHENITLRKTIEQERRENTVRLSALSRNLLAVQEDARRRLAAELHDRTSPALAAVGINLAMASMSLRSGDLDELALRLEDNDALLEETAVGIRDICADLRPPALDYAGLAPAIEGYAERFSQRMGIRVRCKFNANDVRLAPALESMLFRIFQEAMTNIAKHAQANSVVVILHLESSPIFLIVSDDGQGFDISNSTGRKGLGLINMREMAEFSGGQFKISSAPEKGTKIRVEINAEKVGL
jgi:PAS domain S-box-containing protein